MYGVIFVSFFMCALYLTIMENTHIKKKEINYTCTFKRSFINFFFCMVRSDRGNVVDSKTHTRTHTHACARTCTHTHTHTHTQLRAFVACKE